MTREPVLTARGLVKRYGRVVALDRTDFDLYPGEVLAVIGDNGAGKSTLIKAISGAVTPDAGEIRLEGKPVHFTSPMRARDAGIETHGTARGTGGVIRTRWRPRGIAGASHIRARSIAGGGRTRR